MDITINNQREVRSFEIEPGKRVEEFDVRASQLVSIQELNFKPAKTYLYNSEIKSCRFIKGEFTDGVIDRVEWRDCDLTGVSFYDSKIASCEFNICKLGSSNWRNTTIRKLTISGSDLREADFSGSDIKDLDIRGCRIEAIKIPTDMYKYITIDRTQAIYFASLSGLNIKDL